MTEREEFDKIVEGLDLDFSFPDELDEVTPPAYEEPESPAWVFEHEEEPEPVDVPFYRQVDPTPLLPRHRGTLVAWAGLLGTPALLALFTLFGVFLSRSILAGAALIFVAAAIYLILQLPEHGPGRRDWPDDGAVL